MRVWETAVVMSVLVTAGCAHSLSTTVPVGARSRDRSVAAPALREKAITSVMVLPPSGTVRGQFERVLNLVERAFLERGVTVITPAVTGRVAGRDAPGEPRREAASLTDLERALIMAGKSGVDAVLQVGEYEWRGAGSRYFCDASECDEYAYRNARYRIELVGRTLHLTGRLIDVVSGAMLASIDLEQDSVHNFPWTAFERANPSGEPTIRIACSELLACASDLCRACIESESLTVDEILSVLGRVVAPTVWLGVAMFDLGDAPPEARLDPSIEAGAYVTDTDPGGPAQRAGILAGDIIVDIDGQPVRNGLAVVDLLKAKLPGTVIEVTLLRQGARRIVRATLGTR